VVGVLLQFPIHLLRHFLSDLLQLLKPCLLLYQHQYPLGDGVCSLTELEAPTASVAIGFPVIVNPIIGSLLLH
jgi:hypothetical protein